MNSHALDDIAARLERVEERVGELTTVKCRRSRASGVRLAAVTVAVATGSRGPQGL